MNRCWLVDSSIYVFRAWFQQGEEFVDVDGNSVGAVHGFIDFVDKLMRTEQPQHIGFAFDESLSKSHRKNLYPDYKSNRRKAPDNLRYQFQCCREYLRVSGLVEAASNTYEADDVIATWANHYRRKQFAYHVISADKDLAQLIGVQDTLWDYGRDQPINEKKITKQFKVRPDQIADLLALAGDKADNIPGVPGVGMATAAKLLIKFETISQLLTSISDIGNMKFRGAKQIQELVSKHQEAILCYQQLTRLHASVPDIAMDLQLNSEVSAKEKLLFLQRINK
ncbi:MAG: DNA polymerase I (EC [uncultured Thiotrichaceae bacterium]|uniref:DNA polymerase I (EC) n=1 Tax=uncultured Thiotrichaceae bacterium TaxID=298394 RepID=A0A6S6UDF8_9GAMM|nr:MAG: DNA polymerase I (EC [uncultured Thiotrichaceae bacterium]